LTYCIPPFTTIRGLLSNALGLQRDDLKLQDNLMIGIKPLEIDSFGKELAKILKLKGDGKSYQKDFPSSPMFKEFLIKPKYQIFLVSDKVTIDKLYNAILDPERPLYLGGSDELVDVESINTQEIEEIETFEVHSATAGLYQNSIIEKLPYKFIKKGNDYLLEYLTVSIPIDNVITLPEAIKCFSFGDMNVSAY
jgi:CRISPR-associated protein Cas5h